VEAIHVFEIVEFTMRSCTLLASCVQFIAGSMHVYM